jgi:hypothetical protein
MESNSREQTVPVSADLLTDDQIISEGMRRLALRRWDNTTKKQKKAMSKRYSAMGRKSRASLTAAQRREAASKGGKARAANARKRADAEKKSGK